MSGSAKPVTEAEEQAIEEAYEAGATFRDLTSQFHRANLTLRAVLILRGVKIRSSGAHRKGPNKPPDTRTRCKECTIILAECPPEVRAEESNGKCGWCSEPARFLVRYNRE